MKINRKYLTIGVIILFVGVSSVPCISNEIVVQSINQTYEHDVGIKCIESPKENKPGQIFPVQATIGNVGQNIECCISIDIKIGEPLLLDTLLEESSWPNSYPQVPATGWTDEHKNIDYYYGWRASYTSNSGGAYPEACLPSNYAMADHHFYSFAIDTSSYSMLILRFKSYINHSYGKGLYSLEAGYSADAETWYTTWHEEPDASQCFEVDVPIGGGSETTYIGFWVKGDPNYFNYWYIDDVELVVMDYIEEYSDSAYHDPDINPKENVTFDFDYWTPDFLSEETTGQKDYIVECFIEMEGDQNPSNDIKIELFTLDYWHDIAVENITSPETDIPSGVHSIEAIVINHGTFPEIELTASAVIKKEGVTIWGPEYISNINLDLPLGGTQSLYFGTFNFSEQDCYDLTVCIPLEHDDFPDNNCFTIRICVSKLLIIAHEDFCNALQPLKNHKDATGIATIIKSWQSIDNEYQSQGIDVQERIKLAIDYYKKVKNVEWVMLVGDCDKFPVRYVKAYNVKIGDQEWGNIYFPSDLYYADLYDSNGDFDDWDGGDPPYGGNGTIGEMNFDGFSPPDMDKVNLDKIDGYPDVKVGRIPASNVTEVTTYVNKVISYEKNAYLSEWFYNALWVVDCDANSPDDKNRLDVYLPYYNIIKAYNEAGWATWTIEQRASYINNVLNEGVGFANYMGHGSGSYWSNVYGYKHMKDLTNKDMLPIAYGAACLTGRFHFHKSKYWTKDGYEFNETPPKDHPEPNATQPSDYDLESLAEEFTVKRDTGGISYVGASSVTVYGGDDIDKYFFEAYYVYAGITSPTLGYMWNYAIREWMDNYNQLSNHAFYHRHLYILFGDPSLRVGGCHVPKPPTPPIIEGPSKGPVGEELFWKFSSDDPNDNKIKYIIDWGDKNSEETDYYPDCTTAEIGHTYEGKGTYTIIATAEDEEGLMSEESTFIVEMPRPREIYNLLFLRLFEKFPNLFPIIQYILRFQ